MESQGDRSQPSQIKPFLNWAGGKQWLVPVLSGAKGFDGKRYYEPFLGGGAMFFSLQPNKAVLSDVNPRLIETFRAVRNHPDEVIGFLSEWKHSRSFYYKMRSQRIASATERAAQFLYLNRTCWNGLYRVNRLGEFNVPMGDYDGTALVDTKQIHAASKALRSARLRTVSFVEALKEPRKGDLVYCDPPYTVTHGENGFLKYNERIFSWQDQRRLANMATELKEVGCHVVVSNAWHESVTGLYEGFRCYKLSRHSVLAANADCRRKGYEALISTVPLGIEPRLVGR